MPGKLLRHALLALGTMLLTCAASSAQAPLTLATSPPPTLTAGTEARIRIRVAGGTQPLKWRVSSGKLPPGLKLNPTKGTISGTPTTPGTYNCELTVTDSS